MKYIFLGLAGMVLSAVPGPSRAGEVSRRAFGALPDGKPVQAIKLTNHRGMAVTVITLGASLQSVIVPDRRGRNGDVLLGHATLAEYLAKRQYMGATVGRVANRIGGGRFTLDGQAYQVNRNDGENTLHGGQVGFDQIVWDLVATNASRDSAEVKLHHASPDGAQGFPGNVDVSVTYRLDERNCLTIRFAARTDRPTVLALSNHAYWNLAGEGTRFGALDQLLTIPAEAYTPVDAGLIPTGEVRPVAGTVFDFRRQHAIGERVRDFADEQIRIGRGYDHNWVVTRSATAHPHLMARLSEPHSGRVVELWSDQPGLQFYSGNFLDSTTHGKAGRLYRQGDAIVLEPQAFPDTVNRPDFGSVRLAPGETYRNTIIYKFAVSGRPSVQRTISGTKGKVAAR